MGASCAWDSSRSTWDYSSMATRFIRLARRPGPCACKSHSYSRKSRGQNDSAGKFAPFFYLEQCNFTLLALLFASGLYANCPPFGRPRVAASEVRTSNLPFFCGPARLDTRKLLAADGNLMPQPQPTRRELFRKHLGLRLRSCAATEYIPIA